MTPKEKAEELVDKYRGLVISAPYMDSENDYCIAETTMLWRSAKRCALIAVDELINTASPVYDSFWPMNTKDYWQEVKQEIKNI